MIAERLRILGLYARRFVFGKSAAEHAASLRNHLLRSEPARESRKGSCRFDQVYGTETAGSASFLELRSGWPVDAYATAYCSCCPGIVRRSIELLPDISERTFIDLGCGEGRALIVASEFPFRAILGVELSPALCATASANAARLAARFSGRTQINVIQGDAGTFEYPRGPLVVFLYHPFQKPVMKRVLQQMERAARRGTDLFVMYLNPVLGESFDRSSHFRRYFARMLPVEEPTAATASPDEAVVMWTSSNRVAPIAGAEARIRVTCPGWRAEV